MSLHTARRSPGHLGRVILRRVFANEPSPRHAVLGTQRLRVDTPRQRVPGSLLRRARQVE